MGDLKTRLSNARAKLLRRGSQQSTRSTTSSAGSGARRPHTARSASLTKLPEVATHRLSTAKEDIETQQLSQSAVLPKTEDHFGRSSETVDAESPADGSSTADQRRSEDTHISSTILIPPTSPTEPATAVCPAVTLEEPTPIPVPAQSGLTRNQSDSVLEAGENPSPLRSSTFPTSRPPPPGPVRRQSLVTPSNARVIKTLLDPEPSPLTQPSGPPTTDYFSAGSAAFNPGMLHRKIWVKRPNASATLVQIKEDDLVDDVRDMILKKYANSLGRSFDAPDVVLRICPRDNNSKNADRILGPEEEMCRTLDAYYPGGQTVHEALLIEVPQRRTPKPSPRAHGIPYFYHAHDDSRPHENATEYFPPMPIVNPSPGGTASIPLESRGSSVHQSHSIAVLQTGQLPPLPSPGGRKGHHSRPKYPRHNTASPITLTGPPTVSATRERPPNRPRHDSSASDAKHSNTGNPPVPTPPAQEPAPGRQNSTPPTPRVSSPRPGAKRKKKKDIEIPTLPAGLLDGSVPPINVLIVEDNIINLRVLGAFMQRLKVRWQRAMNGQEAVTKWRAGGFHLVLMDIQLPVMNGLDATKEIRRLERVNSIGVFSSGSSEAPNHKLGSDGALDRPVKEEDKLSDMSLFKSPVIIVALTASSLQSDRHEALAAGCNDFLTKPVNFVWLERKVKEWGCMQALIDFDGWRKWKDFASSDTTETTSKLSSSYSSTVSKAKANAAAPNSKTGSTTNGVTPASKHTKEEKAAKRRSLGVAPTVPEEGSPPNPEIDG